MSLCTGPGGRPLHLTVLLGMKVALCALLTALAGVSVEPAAPPCPALQMAPWPVYGLNVYKTLVVPGPGRRSGTVPGVSPALALLLLILGWMIIIKDRENDGSHLGFTSLVGERGRACLLSSLSSGREEHTLFLHS